eukprot:g9048.t1 g9048   contig34:731101-733615(+)
MTSTILLGILPLTTTTTSSKTYYNGQYGHWEKNAACPSSASTAQCGPGYGALCVNDMCASVVGKCNDAGDGCLDLFGRPDECSVPKNSCGDGYCGTPPVNDDCQCFDGKCFAVKFVPDTDTTDEGNTDTDTTDKTNGSGSGGAARDHGCKPGEYVCDHDPCESSSSDSTTDNWVCTRQYCGTCICHCTYTSGAMAMTGTRRAEARAYIIENKLMDIQSHVVKIPVSLQALESLGANVSSQVAKYLKDYSPHLLSETFKRVGGSELLTNKYTAWMLLGSILVFWQYRLTMYQRTSEEVANVAAMTLQQDSLRKTILETLTTVANSPETLSSLSSLFQSLISEERTEQHLINLIVRALNSEGVRLAAIQLLQVCFQDPNLQSWGGEFLKVAAKNTVLDEGVQKSAGVGIQKALKSAVLVPLPWWKQHHDVDEQQQKQSTGKDNEDEDGDNNGGIGEVNDLSGGKTPDTNNTTK